MGGYLFTVIMENPKAVFAVLFVYLIIFILADLNRQHCRFNALIRLLERVDNKEEAYILKDSEENIREEDSTKRKYIL